MKKFVSKIAIIVAIAGTVMTPSVFAGSVAGTGGSTEVTQILNNMELINTNIQQAKQLEVQIRQAMTLPAIPWIQKSKLLQQLGQVVNKGMAIGYELDGFEYRFSNLYKDYKSGKTFRQAYVNWANTTRDSIRSAMTANGMQMQDFQSEEAALEKLRMLSDNASGQMQAMQAGNAISVQMVSQLQMLRTVMNAQNQAHNAYMAQKVAADESKRKSADDFAGKMQAIDFATVKRELGLK